MAEPIIQPSFAAGELSPALWSRVDLAKFHVGVAKARNFFIDYRGGIANRPGTAFVGQCKANPGQSSAGSPPPRNIPFTYSTLQAYVLEFGDNGTLTPNVAGAASASGLIRLQIASTAGIVSGAQMTVAGVVGTTEANGVWNVNVIDGTHVDLINSVFTNAYVSGGTTSTPTTYMRVIYNPLNQSGTAGYVLEPAVAINSATQASPCVVGAVGLNFANGNLTNGDWVYIQGVGGMTQLNGNVYQVTGVNLFLGSFVLQDLFGNAISSASFGAYTSGGTVARIATFTCPWGPNDMRSVKFTQSADTMTLVHPSYTAQQITRSQHWTWTVTQVTFASSQAAPTIGTATPSMGAGSTNYNYVVTATSANGLTESVASGVATGANSKTMSATSGAYITLTWTAPAGTPPSYYTVYRQMEVAGGSAEAGQLFGFVGTSVGLNFIDANIIPDFTRAPPLNFNPFTLGGNPGAVAYFQQRQVFGGLSKAPEQFDMSRSGDYLNMDFSTPSRPNDGIQATIASQRVNSIKHLIPMQSLIALSASGAWKIDAGQNGGAVTPSNLSALPQAFNGACDVPPIAINYDILYVQAKGALVRDLAYNFYVNMYTGQDMTVLSNHLFFGHQIVEWAWAEEPFRLVWAVRDDGVLLSFTYVKDQDVYAWAHHDTQGLFFSVASISEGQEDAVYFVVGRLVNGNYVYYQERLASRNMQAIPEYDVPADLSLAWFADCALQYPLTFPNGKLIPAGTGGAAAGFTGAINYSIVAVTNSNPGSGLTAPTVTVTDAVGTGSGAVITAQISGGKITGYTIVSGGQFYSSPVIKVNDPTGSGVVAAAQVSNDVLMNATVSQFVSGDVGKTVRINNGIGTVRQVNSGTQIVVNVSRPLLNSWPAPQNAWSMTKPVTTISGLSQLNGQTVSILADGSVQPQQTVVNGTVTLQQAATAILIGLPIQAQTDSLYLDIPGEQPTVQGKRKKIQAVTLRLVDSRGLKTSVMGVNPNTQQPAPLNLIDLKERDYQSMGQPILPITGDVRVVLDPIYTVKGQIRIQQDDPLPATITAFIPEVALGDV